MNLVMKLSKFDLKMLWSQKYYFSHRHLENAALAVDTLCRWFKLHFFLKADENIPTETCGRKKMDHVERKYKELGTEAVVASPYRLKTNPISCTFVMRAEANLQRPQCFHFPTQT